MAAKDEEMYCRLCLITLNDHKRNYKKLFSHLLPLHYYLDIIESVGNFRIMPDDVHSKVVCVDCWKTLNKILRFKELIQRSDRELKKFTPVKRPTKTYSSTKYKSVNKETKITAKSWALIDDNDDDDDERKPVILNETFKVETEIGQLVTDVDIEECDLETKIKQEFIEEEEEQSNNVEAKFTSILLKPSDTSEFFTENDEPNAVEKIQSFDVRDREEINDEKLDITETCLTNIKTEWITEQPKNNVQRSVSKNLEKNSFQCKFCKKAFRYYRTYLLHCSKHTGGTFPLTCTICNKRFKKNSDLLDHERQHVGKRCNICNKHFRNPNLFRIHKINHNCRERYRCPKCGKVYTTWIYYQKHLSTHPNDTDRTKIKCKECNEQFESGMDRWTHVQQAHRSDSLLCDICGKMFECNLRLINHKSTHTSERSKCRVCKKEFHLKSSLRRHMHNFHSIVDV